MNIYRKLLISTTVLSLPLGNYTIRCSDLSSREKEFINHGNPRNLWDFLSTVDCTETNEEATAKFYYDKLGKMIEYKGEKGTWSDKIIAKAAKYFVLNPTSMLNDNESRIYANQIINEIVKSEEYKAWHQNTVDKQLERRLSSVCYNKFHESLEQLKKELKFEESELKNPNLFHPIKFIKAGKRLINYQIWYISLMKMRISKTLSFDWYEGY